MKNADAYKTCISNANLADTGFSYTLSLINGKYKMTILYTLMSFGVVRFNEMKKYIGEISYKTLSSTLKELEADQATMLEGDSEVRVTDVPQGYAVWLVTAVVALLVVTAWRRA